MEGEHEYGFWHVLVRDVCYGQIPRAARATRHLAAASWIEEKASERAEDLADVLAYHYQSALELNQAAGLGEEQEQLQAQVVRYLAMAGERAPVLSTSSRPKGSSLAPSISVPTMPPERASLLEPVGAGRTATRPAAGMSRAGVSTGLDLYREQGEPVAAGRPHSARARRPPARRSGKRAAARRGS